MTRFFLPAREPDQDGWSVSISPESAGWDFSSLRVLTLRARETASFVTGDAEWLVLPLSGSCVVTCDDTSFELEGRRDVFSRVTDFSYLPRGSVVSITSEAGGRFALPGARCDNHLPFRYGPAENVPVELRGAGSASRQANNFASPAGFETDRLISVEVLTPGGNWSSYPPHKHDTHGPDEAELEEIYYFEVAGGTPSGVAGPGGYQRVYSADPARPIDVLVEVATGDSLLIPYGYHGPTMASAGYDLYFLNVLAGAQRPRTMAFCDDPAHAWIRESWQNQSVDPRLPLTSSKGIR